MPSNFKFIPDHELQPAPAVESTLKPTPFHALVTKIGGGLIVRPDLIPVSGDHTNIVSAASVSAERILKAAGLDKLNYAQSLPVSSDERQLLGGSVLLFESRDSIALDPAKLVEKEYDELFEHHSDRLSGLDTLGVLTKEQHLQRALAHQSLIILTAYDTVRSHPKNKSRHY